MARVVAFIPDLLFGSAVVSALQATGHEVELTGDVSAVSGSSEADLLVVDLTFDVDARIEQVRGWSVPKLAFYSHVEPDVRARAEEAGFDLVVPRSRMAREGAALADRVIGGSV